MQGKWMGFSAPAALGLLVILGFMPNLGAGQSSHAGPGSDRPDAAQSTSTPASSQATQRADIFDPAADAKAQIAAAIAAAQRDNQRVLLLLGGNWCPWCHRLHALFREHKDIARMLRYEYQLVLVDVGRFNKNTDLVTGYGLELKKAGLPFLVVLGSDGKVLVKQETGSLEQGKGHDPEKVLEFLAKWKAEPRDAETVLKDGLARAAAEHKSVLLHLDAPWCVWCRRLEAFLARPEIEALLDRDFIDLDIDIERMTHAKEIVARFCGKPRPGLPWLAILDAAGKVVVTSDAPEGNIGYPTTASEISYFLEMLHKGTAKLSAGDFRQIEEVLKEAAAKFKPAATTQP
jgi:thiol:disulfide interchange protein